MKLTRFFTWLKHLPTAAVIAAAVLLCAVIAVPLLFLPGTDAIPVTPGGTLRNPVVTAAGTEDPGAVTEAPFVFTPAESDFALSVPAGSAGSLYAVPTTSAVFLSTAKALTGEQMLSLSVTPETPISVTASDGGYLITPVSGDWEQDTLYRLSDGGDGMLAAFQTVRTFAVESVYPAHEETGVPIDTGIEITFSDTVQNTDLASYITVTPAIDGRFEIYPNGRTVVIIPDEHLQRQAQYTVTVAQGMPSDNGTTLSEEYRFGFFTMQATSDAFVSELRMSTERELLSSPGTAAPLFYRLYYTGSRETLTDTAIKAKIYAYDSTDAVRDALLSALDDRVESVFSSGVSLSPDGLACVWDGAVEVYRERIRETNESGYLYLPTLDEGVYLVELYANAVDGYGMEKQVSSQLLWQVTPLRAYTESVGTVKTPDGDSGSDTLIWVHSTETGDAVSGAKINMSAFVNSMWDEPQITTLSDKTGDEGHAILVTDEKKTAALVEIEHGGHALLLCTTLAKNTLSDTCRVYLYTDRAVYFANDTVYFHGVLGRAYVGQTLPDTLSLSVAGNDTGLRVAVNEDGTFGGSFQIEDWLSSYISFTLRDVDGRVNTYRSLRITEQDKPLYTLDISYDRPFYTLEHQTAVVTAQLSYFDGTPAAGMELQFHVDSPSTHQTVTTDEDGIAVFPYKMPSENWTQTAPVYSGVSVQLTGYETASLYQYAHTYYFHSSGVMTSARVDRDHSVLYLHALDTSRIQSTADIYGSSEGYPQLVQGMPLNTQVSVTLEKTYYVKKKNGQTSYDPINKVTVEYYDYTPMKETVRTFTADVVNGEVSFDHIDTAGQECSYTYIVRWYDAASGRTYIEHIYANRSNREYSPYNTPYYELTADKNAALVGEDITVSLYYGGEPAEVNGKTVLFTRYNATELRTEISADDSNTHRYTFDEPSAAGSIVYAAVFDGESYVTHLSHTAVYDHTRGSMAEMTVSADRDTYKPGERATVTVKSPDLAGGTVLVSAVDEACFALGEQSVNLAEYFRFATSRYWSASPYRLPNVIINSRVNLPSMVRDTLTREQSKNLYDVPAEDAAESEAVMDMEQEAPATGGVPQTTSTPAYIREVFLDNAAFVTVALDENGTGSVEIDVPDNITTWRLTAIGFSGVGMTGGEDVTSGVRCATAVGAAVCTQPFFLNVTLPDLILSEDAVSFSARTAGTVRAADPAAAVTYTAVLHDETGNEIGTFEASAAAKETAWFTLDALAAGEYRVTVTGICGEYSDAVRASFRVVDTAQIAMAEKTITPGEISALTPAAYPLTLTFFDGTDTLYYEVISRLSGSIGARIDAKAAAHTALAAREAVFGADSLWYAPGSIADTIRAELSGNYWGFLPLTQYGQGDPVLTAEILYAAPDVLSAEQKSALVTEYQTLLDSASATGEQTAAALLGLACLDRPVLDLLFWAAQSSDSMTDAEILYLSAAFAAIGDMGAARALWEPLRDAWGQAEAGDAFCIVGGDTEETIHLTALALLPASVIDPDTACAMVRYLLNHTSSVDLHVLELAAFVTHYTPTAAEETHLTYRLQSGEDIHVTLHRGQSHRVTLTAADHRTFTLISADDALCAIAAYGAKPADAKMEEDTILTLSKTITPYRAEDGIYRVTITFAGETDVDHLQYSLADTIPAGARYFVDDGRSNYSNLCAAYLYNRGGQQMRGTISVWNPILYSSRDKLSGNERYAFSGSISYLIRAAVKGTFTAEPALAINYEHGTYACSEEWGVTVQDGEWEIWEE